MISWRAVVAPAAALVIAGSTTVPFSTSYYFDVEVMGAGNSAGTWCLDRHGHVVGNGHDGVPGNRHGHGHDCDKDHGNPPPGQQDVDVDEDLTEHDDDSLPPHEQDDGEETPDTVSVPDQLHEVTEGPSDEPTAEPTAEPSAETSAEPTPEPSPSPSEVADDPASQAASPT